MRVDGIDLSHWQTDMSIDYARAKKAGLKFIYHKATEGTGNADPDYKKRRAEAAAAGVPFGAYHFAEPSVGDAKAQAEHFLKYATPEPGDMVPALDLEVNPHKLSEAELTTWVHTWFTTVYAATGTRKGLLYTPFNTQRRPVGVRLWTARYNNDNRKPTVPRPFWTWTMWQFTDGKNGTPKAIAGMSAPGDMNTLHARYPWARVKALRLGVKPTPVKPKPAKKETAVAKIVRVATSQVGYHEGRSQGHWNNHQKFSPAVPGLAWSQNQPWCATFVSWCALKAGLAAFYPCTASTVTGAAWFKSKNQWSEYPAVGAQVFYGVNGHMEHTGLVYKYDAKYLYTVEGNTNVNGSAEGDGVYLKKRVRADPYVQGYGYPALPGGLASADPNYKRSKS